MAIPTSSMLTRLRAGALALSSRASNSGMPEVCARRQPDDHITMQKRQRAPGQWDLRPTSLPLPEMAGPAQGNAYPGRPGWCRASWLGWVFAFEHCGVLCWVGRDRLILVEVGSRVNYTRGSERPGLSGAWKKEERMRACSIVGLLFAATVLVTIPVSPQLTPRGVELSVDQAQAVTYRRARVTARRVDRRSYRQTRRAVRRTY